MHTSRNYVICRDAYYLGSIPGAHIEEWVPLYDAVTFTLDEALSIRNEACDDVLTFEEAEAYEWEEAEAYAYENRTRSDE